MKNILLILSGCGVYDGSEIYESTFTMLAIEENGASFTCCAPDVQQAHVINHLTGETEPGSRSVLTESARLARGKIAPLEKVHAKDFDALIIPGGFGSAKNLCNFAFAGNQCTVNSDVERLICEFHQAKKPMGFLCIAPVIVAKVLGKKGVCVTIGNDKTTATAIESFGAKHQDCTVESIVVDITHRVVTTPAYMLGENMLEVRKGIAKAVEKVLDLS